jgi:hypothetical protein
MNNKQKQIKYNQQKYYIDKYKKNKAVNDIILKRKDDVIVRIIDNIIFRHTTFFKNNNINLEITQMKLLGCTKKEFENHIINNLKENMSLENYGDWEVDHIYPISKINFEDTNEIIIYYNYTNLQPLWKEENKKKSDKL